MTTAKIIVKFDESMILKLMPKEFMSYSITINGFPIAGDTFKINEKREMREQLTNNLFIISNALKAVGVKTTVIR